MAYLRARADGVSDISGYRSSYCYDQNHKDESNCEYGDSIFPCAADQYCFREVEGQAAIPQFRRGGGTIPSVQQGAPDGWYETWGIRYKCNARRYEIQPSSSTHSCGEELGTTFLIKEDGEITPEGWNYGHRE